MMELLLCVPSQMHVDRKQEEMGDPMKHFSMSLLLIGVLPAHSVGFDASRFELIL
jgi:hypothetical protein